jgi:hypothetical protein
MRARACVTRNCVCSNLAPFQHRRCSMPFHHPFPLVARGFARASFATHSCAHRCPFPRKRQRTTLRSQRPCHQQLPTSLQRRQAAFPCARRSPTTPFVRQTRLHSFQTIARPGVLACKSSQRASAHQPHHLHLPQAWPQKQHRRSQQPQRARVTAAGNRRRATARAARRQVAMAAGHLKMVQGVGTQARQWIPKRMAQATIHQRR